jgi:hypothetical protein
MENLVKANQDVNLLYKLNLGGGIKGRKVKSGDVLTLLEIDKVSKTVCFFETLHKISIENFESKFTRV